MSVLGTLYFVRLLFVNKRAGPTNKVPSSKYKTHHSITHHLVKFRHRFQDAIPDYRSYRLRTLRHYFYPRGPFTGRKPVEHESLGVRNRMLRLNSYAHPHELVRANTRND